MFHTGFEIIVNYWWLDLVEVLERADSLNDDRSCFLFSKTLVLLEIEIKVVALTVPENRAEPDKVKPIKLF